MFDLEQSIAEWRKQMLAAGIKSPVPLEELEVHLREEVEVQIRSGKNEQQAFEITVLQIGQGQELQTEFSKEWEWRDFFRSDMSKRQKTVLFCWIGICLLGLMDVCEKHVHSPATLLICIISSAIIAIAAYMAGIFWSKFLAKTTKRIRNIIYGIASLGCILIFISEILIPVRPSFHEWVNILSIPIYFNIFTIMLLESRSPAKPEIAAK
jgi:hypothetical protein